MKYSVLFLAALTLWLLRPDNSRAQGMALNTTGSAAHSSAILDASSTTQGVLVPRMTAAQKTAITAPATGLLVYQTDGTAGFYYYNGTSWTTVGGSSSSSGIGTVTTFNTPGSTLNYTFTVTDLTTRVVRFDFQNVAFNADMNINLNLPAPSSIPTGTVIRVTFSRVVNVGYSVYIHGITPSGTIYPALGAAGTNTVLYIPSSLYTDGTNWIEIP